MSDRKYPRFDSARNLSPKTTSICNAIDCTKQATRRVFIQFDYMRGNDECVLSCDDHYKNAYSKPVEFVALFPVAAWK